QRGLHSFPTRRSSDLHIGYFAEGDLVFMGPALPHVWVNDPRYVHGCASAEANAVVVHFVEDFLGENFLCLPELEPLKKVLDLSKDRKSTRLNSSHVKI